MACLLFDHEKPLKVSATGHMMSTGVDECVSITLLYSNQRVAQFNMSINCLLFAPSFLIGNKGVIKVTIHNCQFNYFCILATFIGIDSGILLVSHRIH